jgi:hypothetical protein
MTEADLNRASAEIEAVMADHGSGGERRRLSPTSTGAKTVSLRST